MTDFRALCAELVSRWDNAVGDPDFCDVAEAMDRARVALAEGDGVGPSDEELLRVAASSIDPYDSCGISIGEYEAETERAVEAYGSELIAFARAVLARYGTTHPRPIPPLDATRQLILRLTAELARLHDSEPQTLDLIAEARAFIGTTRPRPIPVAERLPTEADCDKEGRIWWLHPKSEASAPFWYLAGREYVAAMAPFTPVAWLPAAALPLPVVEP